MFNREITRDLTLEESKRIYNDLLAKGWVLQMENEDPMESFHFFDDTISYAQVDGSYNVDIKKFWSSLTCITNHNEYMTARQDLLDVFGPYAVEWN